MTTEASQPDGAYPRLNAELLSSGNYTDMIVSLVGKFNTTGPQSQQQQQQPDPLSLFSSFTCCDEQLIELSGEFAASLPDLDLVSGGMVVEIIGLAQSPTKVAVRCCSAFHCWSGFPFCIRIRIVF
jgi:hypothetical protein